LSVITAAGLSTSLGEFVAGCAAARSGMVRLLPLGPVLPNPGEEIPAELKGHTSPDAAGHEDYGRLIALLVGAVADATPDGGWNGWVNSRTRIVVILPEEADRHALYDIDDVDEVFPSGPDALVWQRLRESAFKDVDKRAVEFVRGGHTAMVEVVGRAERAFRQREAERVLIFAADSLVDPLTLAGLAGQGLLAHAGHPDGMFPGEAGAAIVLETESSAHSRGVPAQLSIDALSWRPAPRTVEDDTKLSGWGLAEVISEVETVAPDRLARVGLVVTDFNGSSMRARYEWDNLLRIQSSSPSLQRLTHVARWSPAESFGDVGSVTGAVHLCIAARAIARGYSPADSVLICNTDDSGAAGVMLVGAPR
jgi:3-oxoacyl-[acyl-carrier-protein] synthase I